MNKLPKFDTILLDVDHCVARIVLNRPHAANAFDRIMALELFHAIHYCDDNPEVRAIFITNAGKVFCGGSDLRELDQYPNPAAYLKEMTTYLHGAISRLAHMDAPVVAAVNGMVGGAGIGLICACDIVYAADTARFVMAYSRAGLSPDGATTYFLPRLVGLRRAAELILTNRLLTAQEALEWGLLNRILPQDALRNEAIKLAESLAAGPTHAFGTAKRLLHASSGESLETQMANEAQTIARIVQTADAQEGITAFVEKREPHFSGK